MTELCDNLAKLHPFAQTLGVVGATLVGLALAGVLYAFVDRVWG